MKKNNKYINKELKSVNKKLIFAITIIILFFVTIFLCFSKKDYVEDYTSKLVKNNEQFIEIKKSFLYNEDLYTQNYQELDETIISSINNSLLSYKEKTASVYKIFLSIKETNDYISTTSLPDIMNLSPKCIEDSMYLPLFNNNDFEIVELKDDKFLLNEKIIGKFPTKSEEIMISNMLANSIIDYGIKEYEKDGYYKPHDYKELVNSNKYFNFASRDKVKIVGVIDYDLSKYNQLREVKDQENNNLLIEKYNKEINNVYNKIYVNNKFVGNLTINDITNYKNDIQYKIVQTGILVKENSKEGFKNIISNLKDKKELSIGSTYTGTFDIFGNVE